MHATIAVKTLNLAICTELLSVTELETCSGKCVKLRPNPNLQHSAGREGGQSYPSLWAGSNFSRFQCSTCPSRFRGRRKWMVAQRRRKTPFQSVVEVLANPDMESYVVYNAQ